MNFNINVTTENSDEAFHRSQNELTRKYVDLQVLKALLQSNVEAIEQNRKRLEVEMNTLDDLHFMVWSLQSHICDGVHNFSVKHDFSSLVKNYPEIADEFSYDCDCGNKTYKVCEREAECEILSREIQELESELENKTDSVLRKDLIQAEIELQKCTSDTFEISRLKNSIDESRNRVNNLKAKMKMRISLEKTYVSPDSSIPATHPDGFTLESQATELSDTNRNMSKRKLKFEKKISADNNEQYFVKASVYSKNAGNLTQFNNTPSCEKIIAEAMSNEKSSASDRPKKKFVMKTKSSVTGRH